MPDTLHMLRHLILRSRRVGAVPLPDYSRDDEGFQRVPEGPVPGKGQQQALNPELFPPKRSF